MAMTGYDIYRFPAIGGFCGIFRRIVRVCCSDNKKSGKNAAGRFTKGRTCVTIECRKRR